MNDYKGKEKDISIPRILVLMSTYNGEQYVRDQIKSILEQHEVEVSLLIRDDGSTDATKQILSEYLDNPKCKVIFGDNIGACKSFLWLIENCDSSEYYSFSDQDDIWLCDKLSTAVNHLIKDKYDLYHGLAGRVDKNLVPLSNKNYIPKNSFGGALLSSATGCTMVWNNKLMTEIKTYIPQNISMHDAWVYRVTFALDFNVYYDNISHMLYRQHESNVSGGNMTFKQKINKIIKNKGLKYHIGEEIYTGFIDKIPPKNILILNKFLNYKKSIIGKFRIIISADFNLLSIKTNIQNKLLFLINMI